MRKTIGQEIDRKSYWCSLRKFCTTNLDATGKSMIGGKGMGCEVLYAKDELLYAKEIDWEKVPLDVY